MINVCLIFDIDMHRSVASRLLGWVNYKLIICHYPCKLELSIGIIFYQDIDIQGFSPVWPESAPETYCALFILCFCCSVLIDKDEWSVSHEVHFATHTIQVEEVIAPIMNIDFRKCWCVKCKLRMVSDHALFSKQMNIGSISGSFRFVWPYFS